MMSDVGPATGKVDAGSRRTNTPPGAINSELSDEGLI